MPNKFESRQEGDPAERPENRESFEQARDFDTESRRLDNDFNRSLDEIMKDTISQGVSGVTEVVGYAAVAAEAGACEQLADVCMATADLQPDEERDLDQETQERLARVRIEMNDTDRN
jgi:hypothetical protein